MFRNCLKRLCFEYLVRTKFVLTLRFEFISEKSPQIFCRLICKSKTPFLLEVTELNWNFARQPLFTQLYGGPQLGIQSDSSRLFSTKSARNLFWRILVTLFKLKHICVEATQNDTHNGTHNSSHKNLQNHNVRKMIWAWTKTGLSWETII